MRKIFLFLIFIIITPINLAVSLFAINNFSPKQKSLSQYSPSTQLFASVPPVIGEVLGTISTGDARPVIVEKYLKKHQSPLLPYANSLLAAAEKYDVDYRLIVAIAQCESNLCKRSPPGSYNCWGFENGETKFLSWEQALNQVAKTLREGYLDKGLKTPEEIMPKYAPPSVDKGGPWAKCVNQFINELELGKVD